jgi:hypothetical protein
MAKLYAKFRTMALKDFHGTHSSIAKSATIYMKPQQQSRRGDQGAARAFSLHILPSQEHGRWLLLPPQRRRPVAGDPGEEKATQHPGFCKEQE